VAAGGEVYHRVAALLDHFEERLEQVGVLVGPPVHRIARVQVDDRRPSLGGTDGGFRDLRCGDRQMR
jgi:hypothetical protein